MDRRQRKTRKSIYDAFEALMGKEHYSSITVAQIIEHADIGRSTFYSHFETKDDLLDQMCEEMFSHIFEGVNEQCVTHADLQATDLKGVLAHLLYHLRDTHSGICGKLISEREPHFISYFDEQLKLLFAKRVKRPAKVPEELYFGMLVSAFVQTVSWWLDNGAEMQPEVVSGLYLKALHLESEG